MATRLKVYPSTTKLADYAKKVGRTVRGRVAGIEGMYKAYPWGIIVWRPLCECPKKGHYKAITGSRRASR